MAQRDEPNNIRDFYILIKPVVENDDFNFRSVNRAMAGEGEDQRNYIPGKQMTVLQIMNIIIRQGRTSEVTE